MNRTKNDTDREHDEQHNDLDCDFDRYPFAMFAVEKKTADQEKPENIERRKSQGPAVF